MTATKVGINVSTGLNNVELSFGGEDWTSMTIAQAKEFLKDLAAELEGL